MTPLVALVLLGYVVSHVSGAIGKCSFVQGAYTRTEGALAGCEYTFTLEFCPRHHREHLGEWTNSVTVEVESNMTKPSLVSLCALRNKVFSSITSDDFKTATTCTKTVNMTTLEGTFQSSMLYSVVIRSESNSTEPKLRFQLHNNHEDTAFDPISVDFRVDPASGFVSFLSPFSNVKEAPELLVHDYPTQIVASVDDGSLEGPASTTGGKTTGECDFNDLLSGQWQFDRSAQNWRWKTHICDSKTVTVEAFVAWCKKYELKSLLFIGTSRTRTIYFDLLYFFGYSQTQVLSGKVHHHMTHDVSDMLHYDLTVHYHWNDCDPDVVADRYMYAYDRYITELKLHFAEMGICTHPSNVPNHMPAGFQHVPSNVDYTSPNYTQHGRPASSVRDNTTFVRVTQPYAVFFSTGICETKKVSIDTFKALVPSVVKFVYESCMGTLPTTTDPDSASTAANSADTIATTSSAAHVVNKNMLFLKLEEAVDPSIAMFEWLAEANEYLHGTVVPALNAQLPRAFAPLLVLDTHHSTRSWKLWNTDSDPLHYYFEHNYHGNVASNNLVNLMLLQLTQMMQYNTNHADYSALAEQQAAMHRNSSVSAGGSTDGSGGARHRHVRGYGRAGEMFPAYTALPTVRRQAIVPFEGRLLQNPYNKRELFFVHEGLNRPIPNWDTYTSLNMDSRSVIMLDKGSFDSIARGPPLPNAGRR